MSLLGRLYKVVRSNVGALSHPNAEAMPCGSDEAGPFAHLDDDPPVAQPEHDKQEAQYYANLELPVGAPYTEIKSAYRRLLRRYHPDKHNQNQEKAEIAEEIVKRLNEAMEYFEKQREGESR